MWHKAVWMRQPMKLKFALLINQYTTGGAHVIEKLVVIYKAFFCFDVTQGWMNGALNETWTHSRRFASPVHLVKVIERSTHTTTTVRQVSFILPIGTCVTSAVATAIPSGMRETEESEQLERAAVLSCFRAIRAESLLAGTAICVATVLRKESLFVPLEPAIAVVFFVANSSGS